MQEEIQRLRERADAADKANKAWEENRQKFIDEVTSKADKLRYTDPDKVAKLKARTAVDYERAVQEARAESATKRIKLEQQWAREPVEQITSPGIRETVREGESYIDKIYPEVLSVAHRKWILLPNKPTDVPASIAAVYRQKKAAQSEGQERASVMRIDGGNMKEQVQIARELQEVNRKYGRKDQAFPLA